MLDLFIDLIWFLFYFIFEMRSHYVAWVGLKLLIVIFNVKDQCPKFLILQAHAITPVFINPGLNIVTNYTPRLPNN